MPLLPLVIGLEISCQFSLERRALLRLCRRVSGLRQDYLTWVLLRGQQLTVLILRMQFVCNSATSLRRKINPSYFSLVSLQFHLKQEEKRIKQLNESKKLKDFQKTQIVSTDFDRLTKLFFCERWFFHPRIRSLGICEWRDNGWLRRKY